MDHLTSLEQRAVEFARRGDFGPEARAVNEELTKLAPANEGAWTRLARCCMELGALDDAAAALDSALQLNPQNMIARSLHGEVTRRRNAALAPPPRARRSPSTPRTSSRSSAEPRPRASRSTTSPVALAGIGRAEFAALGHLDPSAAADALTARVEPILMALNDRPFASKVTEARNRAGHAGTWLFRRGTIRPGARGHVYIHQHGGEWEPQLFIGLFAAAHWTRDALAAGIAFNLAAPAGDDRDDRADVGHERAVEYFEGFQQLVSSRWRVHITDWLRTQGGFVQFGHQPPETSLLPNDAVGAIVNASNPVELGRVFVGRGLFADRGEDIGILTDAPRLIRWLESTFSDLLPLWGDVYRKAYRAAARS